MWSIGPKFGGTNMVVNMTVDKENLLEQRDMIDKAFSKVSQRGVLCHEELRGVRFNVYDAMFPIDVSEVTDKTGANLIEINKLV